MFFYRQVHFFSSLISIFFSKPMSSKGQPQRPYCKQESLWSTPAKDFYFLVCENRSPTTDLLPFQSGLLQEIRRISMTEWSLHAKLPKRHSMGTKKKKMASFPSNPSGDKKKDIYSLVFIKVVPIKALLNKQSLTNSDQLWVSQCLAVWQCQQSCLIKPNSCREWQTDWSGFEECI